MSWGGSMGFSPEMEAVPLEALRAAPDLMQVPRRSRRGVSPTAIATRISGMPGSLDPQQFGFGLVRRGGLVTVAVAPGCRTERHCDPLDLKVFSCPEWIG